MLNIMNLVSPSNLPIVEIKRENKPSQKLEEWSYSPGLGRFTAFSDFSIEEQDRLKGARLVDSSGEEWEPSEVRSYMKYEHKKPSEMMMED